MEVAQVHFMVWPKSSSVCLSTDYITLRVDTGWLQTNAALFQALIFSKFGRIGVAISLVFVILMNKTFGLLVTIDY